MAGKVDRRRRVVPSIDQPLLFGSDRVDALNPEHLPPVEVPTVTRATDAAVAMIDAQIAQLVEARRMILAADSDSEHANALFGYGVLDRLESSAAGAKIVLVATATEHAEEALSPQPEVDPDGDQRRPRVTAQRVCAWDLGAIAGVSEHVAELMIAEADRIYRLMPNALGKMLAGEFSYRHRAA